MDKPWISGPREVLEYGLSLMQKDSDANRRIAIILIDNAVELMIKTYLGLPKRLTKINLSLTAYEEISKSFTKLLDALQEHAADKLVGVDLVDIEWYHRLRNQLYHQGNGLTVEKQKLEVYSGLARLLFKNLFGVDVNVPASSTEDLTLAFLEAWQEFEKLSSEQVGMGTTGPRIFHKSIEMLKQAGLISAVEANDLEQIRQLRNKVVHSGLTEKTAISSETVETLRQIVKRLKRK